MKELETKELQTSTADYLQYEEYVNSFTEKATVYHDKKMKIANTKRLLDPLILILLVVLRVPNYLNNNCPFGKEYSFMSVLWVASLFFIIYYVLTQPLAFFDHRIEEEYEFTTLTRRKWIMNQLKGFAVGFVIFVLLIEALYSALAFTGTAWWIYGFLGYFVVAGILQTLMPIIILPLFTKLEPLPEGELRTIMANLADSMGINYKDIYLWKMSQQTTKANAAVMGFGNTIRIVLGDTLVQNFRLDEIEIVMAHEISHQKHKDVYKGTVFTGIMALIAFYLIELSFPTIMTAFGYSSRAEPATIGFVFMAISIIFELFSAGSLWFTRRMEKAADLSAINKIRNLQVYESAFSRLAMQNLSYPTPSKLEIIFNYSHPPIATRIKYAKEYLAEISKNVNA